MRITVNLQEQFSYSRWPIFLVAVIILISLAAIILPYFIRLFKSKLKRKTPAQKVVIKQRTSFDTARIKSTYLDMLNELEAELISQRVSTRDAYKRMSICIRRFVFDMTGLEVTNYTLEDIKKLQMPQLAALVEEYYTPEFSVHSIGNELESLGKTKKAIEQWN